VIQASTSNHKQMFVHSGCKPQIIILILSAYTLRILIVEYRHSLYERVIYDVFKIVLALVMIYSLALIHCYRRLRISRHQSQ